MDALGQIQIKSLKTLELSQSQAGVIRELLSTSNSIGIILIKTDSHIITYIVEVYFISYSITPLPWMNSNDVL